MSRIPRDAGAVASAVSLTATLTTVVSAVAGLGQFSRTARAYRAIEWINDMFGPDRDDDAYQRPLKGLRVSQGAHLLAVHYMLWWKFMVLPLWMVLVGSLFLYAVGAGKYSSDAAIPMLYYFVFCTWFTWLFIGNYCGRVRIIEYHKAGRLTESRVPLWHMGDKVFIYAICFAVATSALCGAAALAGRPGYSGWPVSGGIVVGLIMLPALIPFVRLHSREWTKETKGGSKSVGNSRTNVPRSLAKLLNFDVLRDELAG